MALDALTEVNSLMEFLQDDEELPINDSNISWIFKAINQKLEKLQSTLVDLEYNINQAKNKAYDAQNEAENAVSEAGDVIEELEAIS